MISFFWSIFPYLVIIVLFSERIANWIPDSKTGALGFMRKVFRAISLKTPNVE